MSFHSFVDRSKCRYNEVIDRCSLNHDINMLPTADLTEVGFQHLHSTPSVILIIIIIIIFV